MRTRGTDVVEAYGAFGTHGLEAACITVVPTTDVAAVAAVWGVDLGSPAADPYEWPPDDGYLSWHVWFVEGPDRIIVVEDNGYRGNDSEVVAAASRLAGGGRVASAYWNVNARVDCVCAENGRVLVGGDGDEVRYAEHPPPEAAELDDLLAPFRTLPELNDSADIDTGPSWVGTALAMVERWTNTQLTLDLLDVEGRTVYLLADRW